MILMSTHNICFWRGDSNEYPQHMFSCRTDENYPSIIIKCPPYLFHCLLPHQLALLGSKWGKLPWQDVAPDKKHIFHSFSVILAVGVKESSRFNNLFTGVNLLVVTYIVICGVFKSETHNWNIDPEEVILMLYSLVIVSTQHLTL